MPDRTSSEKVTPFLYKYHHCGIVAHEEHRFSHDLVPEVLQNKLNSLHLQNVHMDIEFSSVHISTVVRSCRCTTQQSSMHL